MKPVERRNFLALFGDFTFFGAGSSFASQATVLPTFIATLTSSAPVIGLSSTAANGAWLVPQLFAANAIAGAPRRKPAVLWPAAFGRFVSLVLGPLVLALSGRPVAALWGFFILYGIFWMLGLENLRFPEISVGIFTAAQVIGGIISALVMGRMGEKRGTRSIMRLWGVICICTPFVAWVLPFFGGSRGPTALMYAYGLVFVLVGAQGNSVMAGFINYVIELAPASQRTMYIGCANTLAGAPWPALFAIAAIGPVVGLAFSLRVVEPRHRTAAAQASS